MFFVVACLNQATQKVPTVGITNAARSLLLRTGKQVNISRVKGQCVRGPTGVRTVDVFGGAARPEGLLMSTVSYDGKDSGENCHCKRANVRL